MHHSPQSYQSAYFAVNYDYINFVFMHTHNIIISHSIEMRFEYLYNYYNYFLLLYYDESLLDNNTELYAYMHGL